MYLDYTFIADSETMKVEVDFTFDATSLDGKQLVTFEELYDLSNPDEPKKVTEHKDIEDKGQTITFKEKTEVPEEDTCQSSTRSQKKCKQSVKVCVIARFGTVARSARLFWCLRCFGFLWFFYKRRKMKKS